MARFKKKQSVHPDAPLLHEDHGKPMSRRQFVRQGFAAGGASLLTGGVLSLFTNPRDAYAALSPDLDDLVGALPGCTLSAGGGSNLPTSVSTWPVAPISQAPTCWSEIRVDRRIFCRPRATASSVCRATCYRDKCKPRRC